MDDGSGPGPDEGEGLVLHVDLEGGRAVVAVVGELDHESGADLAVVAQQIIEGGNDHIVVDCADLSFMDSGGVAALADLYQRVEARSGTLTMRRCNDLTLRLLDITGLAAFLTIETGDPEQ